MWRLRVCRSELAALSVAGTSHALPVKDSSVRQDRSRVFIAPTRFAAGISHKVGEAAARGLPVVTTTLIASQLGWTHGKELLAADTPHTFAECCMQLCRDQQLWENVRSEGHAAVKRNYSRTQFAHSLMATIASLRTDTSALGNHH